MTSSQHILFNEEAGQELRNPRQSKFKEKKEKKKTRRNIAVVSSGKESSGGLCLNPEELARALETVRQC